MSANHQQNGLTAEGWEQVDKMFWIIMLAGFLVAGFLLTDSPDLEELDTGYHTVQAGETLWTIAEQYKPQNIAMHPYIYELRQINQLENLIIFPGDRLIVLK